MNPLTQIKNTQKISRDEIELGLSEGSSWHSRFKHSAYIFAGGLAYTLTEGDLLAIFAQYGEIVDVSLGRDRKTGKPRGFAFLAYEDQRSTVLAVDNLSGARVAGRVLRVEHVDNYRRKKAEMDGDPDPGSDAEPDAVARHESRPTLPADDRNPPGAAQLRAGDEPWAASGSVFALLNAPVSRPAPSRAPTAEVDAGGTKHREHKSKHKKDKKHKKSRARHDDPSDDDRRDKRRRRGDDDEQRSERRSRYRDERSPPRREGRRDNTRSPR